MLACLCAYLHDIVSVGVFVRACMHELVCITSCMPRTKHPHIQ